MSGLICMLTCDKNPKNLIFLLPLLLLVTTGGMAQQSTRVGDALDISVLLKGGPAKKREAFSCLQTGTKVYRFNFEGWFEVASGERELAQGFSQEQIRVSCGRVQVRQIPQPTSSIPSSDTSQRLRR